MLSVRKLFETADDVAERHARWAEKFERWTAHTKYTPDYPKLESHNWNVFLITDDMMMGRRAHDILRGSEDCWHICTAYTQNDFTMFKNSLGLATYPVVLDVPDRASKGVISRALRGPVRGELWAIKAPKVIDLDKHRLNTVEFRRRRVAVDIPYQEIAEHPAGFELVKQISDWKHYLHQRAWMYVGEPEMWYYQTFGNKNFVPIKMFTPRSQTGIVTHKIKGYKDARATYERLEREDMQPTMQWSNAINGWVVRYQPVDTAVKPYFYYTNQEDVHISNS